jgi:hypothetical protein
MKSAIAACFGLALMLGSTGCCCGLGHPLFPNLGCSGAMGCQKSGIFNWSHCCDTCDQCGDYTGPDIVARTGDNYYPRPATTPMRPGMLAQLHGNHGHPRAHHHHMASARVQPPMMEEGEVISDEVEVVSAETTEDTGDAIDANDADEAAPAEMAEEPAASPTTRAKRIRSNKTRRQ